MTRANTSFLLISLLVGFGFNLQAVAQSQNEQLALTEDKVNTEVTAIAEQIYTNPTLFRGSLCICSATNLTSPQLQMAVRRQASKTNHLLVVDRATDSQLAAAFQSETWRTTEQLRIPDEESERNRFIETLIKKCADLTDQDAMCLNLGALSNGNIDDLSQAIYACLERGVSVTIEVPSTALSLQIGELNIQCNSENQVTDDGRLHLETQQESLLIIQPRILLNLSHAADVVIRLPQTMYYDALEQKIESGEVGDLTAFRRALVERRTAEFPANRQYKPLLEHGSLVIVGGGGATESIWKKFIDLAGGVDANIVVLPTAGPEISKEPLEAKILVELGAKHVTVLSASDRESVSDPQFIRQLDAASGVWFGGGRQWRFVDAYWGTPAWNAILSVAKRGGVIGGSSAGATIQGDLLVRGHPLGNEIMVADGYRHGLGLLPGVAIDQHFKQRNRFRDLLEVVHRFPSVYGIGIDEGTALIVSPDDNCEVIGRGSVWITRPVAQASETASKREYREYAAGSKLHLMSEP